MLHRQLATKYSVKDKDNILTHNQWSGGEYDKNSQSDINLSTATVIISDEHSSNGEYSYKVTPSSETGYFNIIFDSLNDVAGKTALLTLDYLTNSSTSRVNIIQVNSNNGEIDRKWVQLTSDNIFNEVILTSQLQDDCVKIIIRVLLDTVLFLDNITLKIQ